tara:strand:+ start:31 stop:390 length:360 start_codon:yes stop_codon:yes gene_type:complete
MKKKSSLYSDLSQKQLEHLKELYIEKKVDSLSEKELKRFVLEIITHQINNTIGKEEETEAWREMSDFFGEQFEKIILEVKQKYESSELLKNIEDNSQSHRQELLEKNKLSKEKEDMWDD